MKTSLLIFVALGILGLEGCSRSDKTAEATPQPISSPDAARLKSDSERLQQATANAAKAREAEMQASATPSATP